MTADSVLDRIVADVRRRLETSTEAPGLEEAALKAVEERRATGLRSLSEALSRPGVALIAECKKASPSAGVIREDFDAAALATAYAAGGASAISVVTEPAFFKGRVHWLDEVRQAVFTAIHAWSSQGRSGELKCAMTASPMYLSTVPRLSPRARTKPSS